ncbi:MAG TPA: hypothetical protein VFB56_10960 [Nitrospiraceae bacterium]|nr:hypothetical protein [Nitrospiraceae bacterium]
MPGITIILMLKHMIRMPSLYLKVAIVAIPPLFGGIWGTVMPVAMGAPPIDFCENRTADQQLGASLHPERRSGGVAASGCSPLVEPWDKATREDGQSPRKPAKPRRAMKIENLQMEVSHFLQEYRQFLNCCKTDPAELERVEELGEDVTDLLQIAQNELFSEQMKLRGMTLGEMIPPVASARQQLHRLHKQLEELGQSMERRENLDADEAARELSAIQDTENAIIKGVRPHTLPSGAKTGAEIGSSSSVGKDIGKTSTTGTAIGAEGLTGPRIGVNPKTGREIGATGPTGFEIGETGRAGPGIGESPLNRETSSSADSSLRPSTIGSSLQDSTIGSSIAPSTTGSSLSDSTIGSSLGGSSVGSTIQNRSTLPQQ